MQYTLKKSLGQHFLHDEQMCKKIVAQIGHTSGMRLVEIGPGGGAITKYILNWKDIDLKLIEVDDEKVAYLKHTYPQLEDKIIHQDVLKAAQPFEETFSIIGNFPYNISSPIMFLVYDWEDKIDEVIGMFQKEVAQRIASKAGSKVYGILSVLMQTFFDIEYLFDVPPGCFKPPPKVMSGVIKLTHKQGLIAVHDKKKFKQLVKAAFNQRRKTLRNALKGTLEPGALLDPMMEKRAEQLSVEDFLYLHKTYQ
jgi:16S rRNA (adenine1518-N6/adenine1519-N6)-dimethyltransferase